jgi:hypothetical protein
MSQEDIQTTLINDVPRMLLERVLVRLYDDVATINHRIQSVHTGKLFLCFSLFRTMSLLFVAMLCHKFPICPKGCGDNNITNDHHVDVAYLVQTGQITDEDASFILSKVPVTTDPAITVQTLPSLQGLLISSSPSPPPQSNTFVNNVPRKYTGVTTSVASQQPHRPVPKPPVVNVVNTFQVQALWDYNLENEVSSRSSLRGHFFVVGKFN